MNPTSSLLPRLVSDYSAPPVFVDRVFGEPLFYTEREVVALQYAEDGTLWSMEGDSGILRQWGNDGRLLSRFFLSDLGSLWLFDQKAEYIFSAADEIVKWQTSNGITKCRVDAPWVTSMAFRSDIKVLVSGHDDGIARFWNIDNLHPIREMKIGDSEISALAFHPNGKWLAVANEDRIIQIRDWQTSELICSLSGHPDRIPCLEWHPKGEYLISAGWDSTARIWKPPATDPVMLLNDHSEQVELSVFSPDGKHLACADSDFVIHIWHNPESGRVSRVLQGHTDKINTLTFSHDNTRLASAGADHTVHIWDAESGLLLAGPNPQSEHQIALCKHQEKLELLSSVSTHLQIWDTENNKLSSSVEGLDPFQSIAVSPNQKWIAYSNNSHEVSLCNSALEFQRKLPHTRGPISRLVFSADSSKLATASITDGLVWLWGIDSVHPTANQLVREAELVIPEASENCTLESIAFHPSGRYLAVGGLDWMSTSGTDGTFCIWDLQEKEKLSSLAHGVTALAFDPSGNWLVAGLFTKKILLWNFTTQEIELEIPAHSDKINAILFSPNGQWVVSASDDCTIRAWNFSTQGSGTPQVVARQFETAIQSLAFSEDGKYLFTGNSNYTSYRFEFQRFLDD